VIWVEKRCCRAKQYVNIILIKLIAPLRNLSTIKSFQDQNLIYVSHLLNFRKPINDSRKRRKVWNRGVEFNGQH